MTKNNDILFKVLFAIELALLPLVICAGIYLPMWSVGLFVAGVAVANFWMLLFRDKTLFSHNLIISIGNVIVFTVLLIYFINLNDINMTLGVITLVLVWLMNASKVLFLRKVMPESIEAVDFCYVIFEVATLVSLVFVHYYGVIAKICLIAILLTSIVSMAYKVYYIVRNLIFRRTKK